MAVVLYMHLGIAKKASFRMTAMTSALLLLLLPLLVFLCVRLTALRSSRVLTFAYPM